MNEDEKTKLALKYQILIENTSLFAELELSEKVSDEMKKQILGDKENNQIKKYILYNMASKKKCSSKKRRCLAKSIKVEENKIIIEDKKESKKDLFDKEEVMKIINTQDFVGGAWDINDKTKIIKEKYDKEFNLLKGLKDKNIDDKIAMTILIIYFITNIPQIAVVLY